MNEAFQIIDALFLHYVFGTPDRPRAITRRIVWRWCILTGAAVMIGVALGFITSSIWTVLLFVVWLPLAVLSMGAEARLGSPRMSLAIFVSLATLGMIALFVR